MQRHKFNLTNPVFYRENANQQQNSLQTFSKDDILAALQNRHDYVRNSEWHNKPENVRHMAEISHVLKSDDALRSNLNLAVAEIGRDWKKTTKPFEPKEDSEEALK